MNLVVGGSGGLGQRLKPLLTDALYLSSSDLNIMSGDAIINALETHRPSFVINFAVKNVDALVRNIDLAALKTLDPNIYGGAQLLVYTASFWADEQIDGRYIFVSSILADTIVKGTALYSAAKCFNEKMIQHAAQESKYGATFNTIRLGYFKGGLTEKVPDKILEDVIARVPSRRLGTEYDLYRAIKFILDSPYVNGAVIPVDGGIS
jgi:NAD(P)-dependent dehydrogenase (short-subunit alcohol dehydrogenase family)